MVDDSMPHGGYMTVVVHDETTSGDACFVASHPELAGCTATGFTEDEALENLDDARRLYIHALIKRGIEVPRPAGTSGQPTATATAATTGGMALPVPQLLASSKFIFAAASS